MARPDRISGDGPVTVYRHPAIVRLTHWITAGSLLLLLLSGLQILNAHPALYWGETATFARPAAAITSLETQSGLRGWLHVGSWKVETTGLLGASADGTGGVQARAFPPWLTLPAYPDLGLGRQWHFLAAWTLVASLATYLVYNVVSGRMRRELLPAARELKGIGHAAWDHLRLRFPRGEAARRYNVLQKLAYVAVVLVIAPGMVLTGLAMSPAVDAWAPLSEMFGGRQTARTLHFLGAAALVLFVFVHLAMVLAAGPLNEMRSILTGWFVIRREGETE
jgi:thiosulfate reductase cytochrome b subunit